MNSLRTSGLVIGLTAVAMATGAPLAASARDATALYGQGVHAYFAGNATQAERHLSSALALNGDDPRIYYFRALARMRLGRDEDARRDVQTGARLEAQSPGRFAVGSALMRVQGRERLLLERYRQEARAKVAREYDQWRRARYEEVARRDAAVRRRPVTIALDDFASGAGPWLSADAPSSPGSRELGPPGEGQTPDGEPPQEATHVEPLVAGDPFADDPFADDPRDDPRDDGSMATAPHAAVDAESAPAAVEAESAPAEQPAAIADEELFTLDFPPEGQTTEESPGQEAGDVVPDEPWFGDPDDDPFADL